MNWNKESGFEFFRRSLNGELTFIGADYAAILSQPFDTEFKITIEIDYGSGWTPYWKGKFFKTDCKFSEGKVVVTPLVDDDYAPILDGLDKEFDLISLAPEIHKVRYYKRPVFQLYVPGDTVISNFVGGLWWEGEATRVISSTSLINDYNFAIAYDGYFARLTGQFDLMSADLAALGFQYEQHDYPDTSWEDELIRTSDGARWVNSGEPGEGRPSPMIVYPDPDTPGATSAVTIELNYRFQIFGRFLTDSMTMFSTNTAPVPYDDMCDHGNYHRVIGYQGSTSVYPSTALSETPTEWGLYQPGLYYKRPTPIGWGELYPIGRSRWSNLSLWFSYLMLGSTADSEGRLEVWLNDAYPIWSVLDTLLKQLTSDVDFQNDVAYSQILCGTDPFSGPPQQKIFLTPKTNILKSGYDQPARSAKITLRQVLEMLWQTRRCVWWIENGKLRIEHIRFLMLGGSYSPSLSDGIDLTTKTVPMTGKPWATGQMDYTFDRPDMPQRYEFAWGDKVSNFFEGWPADMVSKYVGTEIEKVTVTGFNSDVDYMLANPSGCSNDGFALLSTVLVNGNYVVPLSSGALQVQNPTMSFRQIFNRYYVWDLPCPQYIWDGYTYNAQQQKRYKVSEVKFPALTDPDVVKLVKTFIGSGQIDKLSINLSSRAATATLRYDTD